MKEEPEKEKYIEPEFEKQEKMVFMFDWMENFTEESKIACRQCSSCHGCR